MMRNPRERIRIALWLLVAAGGASSREVAGGAPDWFRPSAIAAVSASSMEASSPAEPERAPNPGSTVSITGIWKSLTSGTLRRFWADGGFIYGESLNSSGRPLVPAVTYDLTLQPDGTLQGLIRSLSSFAGRPQEGPVVIRPVSANRLEGRLQVKVGAKWQEFVWVRVASTETEDPSPPLPAASSREVSQGTCFAAGPDGELLTAYHVIESATYIRVTFGEGEPGKAEIVRVSPANDLALLSVSRATTAFLPFAAAGDTAVGQQVFTVGFPVQEILGGEAKFTEGTVSSMTGPGGETSLLQISVAIQPGNSGGPLVNYRGEVVGVVTSTAALLPFLRIAGTLPQNVNWAVSADYARPLLPQAQLVAATSSREDAIKRAQAAVCRVEATHELPKPNGK